MAEFRSRPLLWRTVAHAERHRTQGRVRSFGYRVEKSSLGAVAYRITIYGDSFSRSFIAERLELVKLVKQDWYCGDRVLYLSLETRYDDSGPPPISPVKVLYDFENVALTVYDRHSWSPIPFEGHPSRRMTEEEFDRQVAAVRNACSY